MKKKIFAEQKVKNAIKANAPPVLGCIARNRQRFSFANDFTGA